MNENVDQMHLKRGENFDSWRRSMILCAGGEVTDPKLLPKQHGALTPASSRAAAGRR